MNNKSSGPIVYGANGEILVYVKVKSNSNMESVEGVIFVDKKIFLVVKIKAIRDEGLANKALIKFLAGIWDIPNSSLTIKSGHTSTYKVLMIKNVDDRYLKSKFAHYINYQELKVNKYETSKEV